MESPLLDPAFADDSLSDTQSIGSSRSNTPSRRRTRARSSRATTPGVGDSLGDELGGLSGGHSLGDELGAQSLGDELGAFAGQSLGDELSGGQSLGDELGGAATLGSDMPSGSRQPSAAHLENQSTASPRRSARGADAGSIRRAYRDNLSDDEASQTASHAESEALDAEQAELDEEYYSHASAALETSIASTNRFLASLKGISSSGGGAGASRRDDTAGLEAAAGAVVRLLRENTAEREAQVRELTDIVRELGRDHALCGIVDDDWVERGAEEDPLGFVGMRAGASSASLDLVAEEDDGLSTSDVEAAEGAEFAPVGPRAPAADQLAHLRLASGALIGSLQAMHEHTQVARAATSDAARRLRALKGVLVAWKTETEGVARSEAWIEADRLASASSKDDPVRNVQAWTAGQVERAQRAIAEAGARAQVLLQPVRCDAFDRLVAELPDGALDKLAGQAIASS
jgi:hypothetical protein